MPSIISLDSQLKEAFLDLVAKQTGLAIKLRDRDIFYEKVLSRIKSFKNFSAKDYWVLLSSKSIESRQEWERLTVLLTNNESYFFRDKEQLNSLKNYIFPELIKRKQEQKTLRLCSAGCSTGQEPYTLAILLKELLPDFERWKILILGIDIDPDALEVARKGIYEPWSFRGVDEEVKKRYFHHLKQQYHLISDIKKLVDFQAVNLAKDPFPQFHSELKEMDLILCRNVFIYFENPTISKILEKFYNTLQSSGYFITGHTELSGINTSQFDKIALPESIIYQRPGDRKIQLETTQKSNSNTSERVAFVPTQSRAIAPLKTPPKSFLKTPEIILDKLPRNSKNTNDISQVKENLVLENINDLLLEIETLLSQEKYQLAFEKVQVILQKDADCLQAQDFLAQIYANLGQYEKAIQICQKLLKIDSFALAPRYLLAKIAEEKGDREEAKKLLKQIIYLEPNAANAYLDLSHIYHKEGDRDREQKMRNAALSILKQLPSNIAILI
jgi:chemotaxis protein methyltransferase CheR